MILSVFLTLLGLTLGLLALSYWKDKLPIQIVSYALLFFLGLVLANVQGPLAGTTGIQYSVGTNTTTQFSYNGTAVTSTTEVQVDNHATFSNLTFGLLLSLLAFFLIAIILFDPKVKF